MKISDLTEAGLGQYLVDKAKNAWSSSPTGMFSKASDLSSKSYKKWVIQLNALNRGGVDMKDPKAYQTQLSRWATKFFSNPEPITVSDQDVKNPKNFIYKLVNRKLSGVDLNDPNNVNTTTNAAPTQVPPTDAPNATTPPAGSAPTTAAPAPANNPGTTSVSVPIGTVVKSPNSPGKYKKTAQGWVNENGQLITRPQSIATLEKWASGNIGTP